MEVHMSLRTVRLLEALNYAAVTYKNVLIADDEVADGVVQALADQITAMYQLDAAARDIVIDVIKGTVPAVKAVRAIKAIAALYDEDAA
jgi:orotate phosphoribosyltransferase-like protein